MSKPIMMNDELHKKVKFYAFSQGRTIAGMTEELWAKELNSAISPSNAELGVLKNSPVLNYKKTIEEPLVIIKTPSGRPGSKTGKPFLRCPVEYDILRHPDLEKEFNSLNCKPPKPISLRIVPNGKDYEPYGLSVGQADLVTYHLFCMATADSECVNGMIDACDYEKMLAFHGMLGQVDVRRNGDNFYPVNELAKMLLALYPRRDYFDKASLVFFDMALKLSINFID